MKDEEKLISVYRIRNDILNTCEYDNIILKNSETVNLCLKIIDDISRIFEEE